MHIEVLVEDSSGAKLLETLLPQVIGEQGMPHTWRLHPYKGIGRLPTGLSAKADPAKRALLDQLPRLLAGYGRTPGIDAVVVDARVAAPHRTGAWWLGRRHQRGCRARAGGR